MMMMMMMMMIGMTRLGITLCERDTQIYSNPANFDINSQLLPNLT